MTKKESDDLLDQMRTDQKVNNFVLRGSSAFFCLCGMSILLFIVTASKDISSIQTTLVTLVTNENVIKLKEDIKIELGAYLPLTAYLEIETNRGLIFIDYVDFVARIIGIKDEELERGRTSAIRNLNSYIKTGTTRSGHNKGDLITEVWIE